MKIITTSIFVFCLSLCFCQTDVIKQYTVEDGLPSPIVYTVVQDKQGFMWFGTDNGLCRFDGFEFVYYTSNEGLPDNEVLELWVDKRGRLWIGCYNSAPAYYENGIIYNSTNSPQLKGLPKTVIYRAFHEDEEGNIWIAGVSYVLKIRDQSSKIFTTIKDYRGRGMLFFYEHEHALYLSDAGRWFKYGGDNFELMNTDMMFEYDVRFYNKTLCTDSTVYAYNVRGAVRYLSLSSEKGLDRESMKMIEFPQYIHKMICDRNSDQLLLGTDNGLYYTDPLLNNIHEHLLPDNVISNIAFDDFGNTWVTTFGNGIYMLQNKRINNIEISTDEIGSVTYCITGEGNQLIRAGTETGLYYEIVNEKLKTQFNLFNSTGVGRKMISMHDVGDMILIATASGIVKMDKQTYERSYYYQPGPVKTLSVYGNKVFCGATTESMITDTDIDSIDVVLSGRSIASCYDQNGILWLATLNAFLTYDGHAFDSVPWYDFEKYGRLAGLSALQNNSIVVGTYNSGIFIKGKEQVHNISARNGLSGNLCRYLYVDEKDHIWVCTNAGLNKIVYNTLTDNIESIDVFDETDGLLSNAVYSVYAYHDTVWVGSDRGISWFNANREDEQYRIPTFITAFKANDQQWHNISALPELMHTQNQISINFTAISFINKANIRYAYRLVGSGDDWNITNQRAVLYSKLKPGKYRFEVYAFDAEGNRDKETAALEFAIRPAYWQTLWFNLIVICTILTIAGVAVFLWVRSIRKKEKEKANLDKQFSELKLESIRAQLNPHFIFNALNSVQTFNIKHDDKQAQKYLADFSRLMRTTLNFAKQDFITVSDEIDYLNNYLSLEKLRYREQFNYHIDASGIANPQMYLIPTQIIQPYLENAIHHGIKMLKDRQGLINLTFHFENNHLICRIEDNGIGIKKSMLLKSPDKAHKSVGMKLAINNIEIINKLHGMQILMTIDDRSDLTGTHEGTVVTITFPLKTATHD